MASYGHTFTSGDTVTPTKLNDGRTVSDIVNADISGTAAIAGTKIAPDFGSQNIVTAGTGFTQMTSTVLRESDASNSTANLVLQRRRAGGAAVQSGDALGQVIFTGRDGTNFINAATIAAVVDGTPGTNDMPGRLIFSTTADGASSVTERMRITSSGNVGIGTSSPGSGTRLNIAGRGLFTGGSLDPFDGTASGVSISYDTVNNIGHVASVQTGVFSRELRLTGAAQTFFIADTERMRIAAGSGNVGIGTSSPTVKLDVVGDINTSEAYGVDGVQVVGNRRTGWTAATGTATRTTFATTTVTTEQLAQRVKALIDDLSQHGLIGT